MPSSSTTKPSRWQRGSACHQRGGWSRKLHPRRGRRRSRGSPSPRLATTCASRRSRQTYPDGTAGLCERALEGADRTRTVGRRVTRHIRPDRAVRDDREGVILAAVVRLEVHGCTEPKNAAHPPKTKGRGCASAARTTTS